MKKLSPKNKVCAKIKNTFGINTIIEIAFVFLA